MHFVVHPVDLVLVLLPKVLVFYFIHVYLCCFFRKLIFVSARLIFTIFQRSYILVYRTKKR